MTNIGLDGERRDTLIGRKNVMKNDDDDVMTNIPNLSKDTKHDLDTKHVMDTNQREATPCHAPYHAPLKSKPKLNMQNMFWIQDKSWIQNIKMLILDRLPIMLLYIHMFKHYKLSLKLL